MNKEAIIVIDMLKDTFRKKELPIAVEGMKILPALNDLLRKCREVGMQVIFAMDSFLENDYLFLGRGKPHSIRGTEGGEVISEIEKGPNDMYLPKRRFSAFYKTDLDQTLRVLNIDTVALTGITTTVCVLATAFDALSHDFKTIIIEDCCASVTKEVHNTVLDVYRQTPLFPYFRIMQSADFIAQT